MSEYLKNLEDAIENYEEDLTVRTVREFIKNDGDPNDALEVITSALAKIGKKFEKGELFLPDLTAAASIVEKVVPILEEKIEERGEERKSKGKVVIGTVAGDIHNIGKNMVAALMRARNMKVIDLGVDISGEEFVNEVEEIQPDILGLSALLTTTAPEQREIIKGLKEKGIRDKIKVMVGGGAVTQSFADEIGADGYEATAPGAAKLAKKWIQEMEVETKK